jgi:hypothetical protein
MRGDCANVVGIHAMFNQEEDPTSTDDVTDADELRLQPIEGRPEVASPPAIDERVAKRPPSSSAARASRYRRNPHASLYAVDASLPRAGNQQGNRVTQAQGIETEEPAVAQRDYVALQALQRVIRTIAYTMLIVCPLLLLFRFLHLAFFSSEITGAKLPAFFLYAFWIATGTAFMSATFLATAEFLQLLMDIQSDTLLKSKAKAKINESSFIP